MRESRLEISSSKLSESVFRPKEKTAQMSTGSTLLVKAVVIYFALVFGTGFLLGTIRELWSIPRFGKRNAELLEQPLMLIAVILAARWTVGRTRSGLMPIENLAIGLMALTLMVIAELLVVLSLRGLSISEYVRTRDPVSGGVYLLMLGLFALMPWVISQSRAASRRTS